MHIYGRLHFFTNIGVMDDTTPAWAQIPKLAMLSPGEIGAMGAFYDEARPCFHWSYHSPYLQVPHHWFQSSYWQCQDG